jgi:hypothetical protein
MKKNIIDLMNFNDYDLFYDDQIIKIMISIFDDNNYDDSREKDKDDLRSSYPNLSDNQINQLFDILSDYKESRLFEILSMIKKIDLSENRSDLDIIDMIIGLFECFDYKAYEEIESIDDLKRDIDLYFDSI